MKNSVTISKIAQEAGVSKTTVSYFLNNKAREFRISEKTCKKIKNVIKKYNYHPNFFARSISLNKSFLTGLISGNPATSFWGEILGGIEDELEERAYHLLLGKSYKSTSREKTSPSLGIVEPDFGKIWEREKKLFDFMNEKNVEGFIFAPYVDFNGIYGDYYLKIAESKPVISILYPLKGISSVYTDNIEGGRIAGEYLYEHGHRKVAYLGFLTRELKAPFDERYLGFREKFGKVEHFKSPVSLIENIKDITAVFCFSDRFVVELYRECWMRGIRIPDDISIIGFDDIEFLQYMQPRPTSIHQYKKEIGVYAGQLLMKQIDENNPREITEKKLIPYLVEGESVKKIR